MCVCIYIYIFIYTCIYEIIYTNTISDVLYTFFTICVYIYILVKKVYSISIYTFLSRFSRCTKLSQCREQGGSATLVIVTLHLLSTLPIQIERLPLTIILLATLSIWYRPVLSRIHIYMHICVCISPALLSHIKHLTLLLFYLLLFCHHYSHLPNDEGTCRERKENCAT